MSNLQDLKGVCETLGLTEAEARATSSDEVENARQARMHRTSTPFFEDLARNLPEAEDILTSEDGGPVVVFEKWKVNKGKPFRTLYCQAKIDAEATGWYLHSEDYGLKCLIAIESHEDITEEEDGSFSITALRVLRSTSSGKALICFVEES